MKWTIYIINKITNNNFRSYLINLFTNLNYPMPSLYFFSMYEYNYLILYILELNFVLASLFTNTLTFFRSIHLIF